MHTRLMIAPALALLLAACGATKQEKRQVEQQRSVKIALQGISDDINLYIQDAARRVSRETQDREIRKTMILWKIQTLADTQRALQVPDPRWALIDLWVMLYQTRLYLEEGDGKGMLGAQEPIALEGIDNALLAVRRRASLRITPERIAELEDAALTWAREHPIKGDEIERTARPVVDEGSGGLFTALMQVPAGIFSIGGGVKDTAQAVGEVAVSADRASAVIAAMPLNTRWQTELLLYSLEELDSTERILANTDKVAAAAADIGETVKGLPDRVQATIVETIRETESTQPEFRKTLAEGRGLVDQAHGTVEQVNTALDKLQETGAWVEKTSANATEAGKAWEKALEQVNLLAGTGEEPTGEPSPPFDIKDAARTAEYATKAAEEVRATVVELRAIVEGEGLDQRLAQVEESTRATLDETTAALAGLIDRMVVGAVIVIAAFFAALLGYRVATRRRSEWKKGMRA